MKIKRDIGIEICANYTSKVITISVGPMIEIGNRKEVKSTVLHTYEINNAEELNDIIEVLQSEGKVFDIK